MVNKPIYGNSIDDIDFGCAFTEVEFNPQPPHVKICHVKVSDLKKIANELSKNVLDTSWIMKIDDGARRSYIKTAAETADALVNVFNQVIASASVPTGKVKAEFGELMVSMGSARALEKLFNHTIFPIAELWKPQVKQNEGFDFHTACCQDYLNFGEAKFVSSGNSHGKAITQAAGFILDEKHFRDRVHLINQASTAAISNLDKDDFGVIAAFSINTIDPLEIYQNALTSAMKALPSTKVRMVYLVGVAP